MNMAERQNIEQEPMETAEAGAIRRQQLSTDAIWAFMRYYLSKLSKRRQEEAFTIMVVGETGTGKSSLINNLLGCDDLAKEGDGVQSETSKVKMYTKKVNGVPVVLYDTPGLSDSDRSKEEQHITAVKEVLANGKIQLVIYCQKLSEGRMRSSLIETFKQYNKIGVTWTQSVIALTFADSLPIPGRERVKEGFNEGKYFNQKLKEWRDQLRSTLVEEVGMSQADAQKINICPTSAFKEELLPDNNGWFVPLWLAILAILTPEDMFRLLVIQDGMVIFHITDRERNALVTLIKKQYDAIRHAVARSKCNIL